MPVNMFRRFWEPNSLCLPKKLLQPQHRTDGSIVLDNSYISAKEILTSYDEVTVLSEINKDIILVSIQGKEFIFFAPAETNAASRGDFCLINDDGFDFPHIMLTEKALPDIEGLPSGKYRWICLYEHESIVNSIVSYEDKIIDAIDRLLELLSMNKLERCASFKKSSCFIGLASLSGM